jgi:hypothetical protein
MLVDGRIVPALVETLLPHFGGHDVLTHTYQSFIRPFFVTVLSVIIIHHVRITILRLTDSYVVHIEHINRQMVLRKFYIWGISVCRSSSFPRAARWG